MSSIEFEAFLCSPQIQTLKGKSPEGWDRLLAAAGREAGFCQSETWARILNGVTEAEPIFLLARHPTGELAGQLLCFVQKPFNRAQRRPLRRVEAAVRLTPTVLHWLDGPIVYQDSERAATVAALLDAVDTLAREHCVDSVSGSMSAATSQMVRDSAVKAEFLRRGYSGNSWATLLVDLNPSEEMLWRSMDHSVRKGVKKCERLGVRVREIERLEDFIRLFVGPYRATEEAYGRAVNPAYFAEVTFREDDAGYYRNFVAQSVDGTVLATLGMYLFNGVATEVASALTPAAYRAKLPAQDILHWEMFRYAKAAGCVIFNLAGVSPHPRNEKEAGIRRFKEKWGGRYLEYDIFGKQLGRWRSIAPVRAMAAKLFGRSR